MEDEELNTSGLREGEGGGQGADGGPNEIPFCGCLTVRYYQPYFDVDTKDVLARILNSLFYCRAGPGENFLALTTDKPDAYGPFWIATSLLFSVAVSSHISRWLSSWMSGLNWEYNFESVVTSASIVYGFAVAVPLVMYIILGQYGARFKYITALCLYGYSLFVYIPATVRSKLAFFLKTRPHFPYHCIFRIHPQFVCAMPSDAMSWVALFGAAAVSGLFLLRNLAPVIATHAQRHEMPLLGLIGILQVALSLSLKFGFYYHN